VRARRALFLNPFGLAEPGFVLLTVWRAPPLLVVVISALGGIALAMIK
jgi:chromate transporter